MHFSVVHFPCFPPAGACFALLLRADTSVGLLMLYPVSLSACCCTSLELCCFSLDQRLELRTGRPYQLSCPSTPTVPLSSATLPAREPACSALHPNTYSSLLVPAPAASTLFSSSPSMWTRSCPAARTSACCQVLHATYLRVCQSSLCLRRTRPLCESQLQRAFLLRAPL